MKKTFVLFVLMLLSGGSFAQISKEVFSNAVSKETFPHYENRKEERFYNAIQVSLLMGNIHYTERVIRYLPFQNINFSTIVPDYYPNTRTKMAVSPSVVVTSGFRINNHWATGAGVGFEIFDHFLFPLFAEMRYTFSGRRISPFVTVKGGYAFGNFKRKHYDNLQVNWYPYLINDARLRNYGGIMLNPELGLKVPMDENSDLLITAAFRYQKKKSVARKEYDYDQFEEWEHKEVLNRLSLGVAIMF